MDSLTEDELEKIASEEKPTLPLLPGKLPSLGRSFTAEEISAHRCGTDYSRVHVTLEKPGHKRRNSLIRRRLPPANQSLDAAVIPLLIVEDEHGVKHSLDDEPIEVAEEKRRSQRPSAEQFGLNSGSESTDEPISAQVSNSLPDLRSPNDCDGRKRKFGRIVSFAEPCDDQFPAPAKVERADEPRFAAENQIDTLVKRFAADGTLSNEIDVMEFGSREHFVEQEKFSTMSEDTPPASSKVYRRRHSGLIDESTPLLSEVAKSAPASRKLSAKPDDFGSVSVEEEVKFFVGADEVPWSPSKESGEDQTDAAAETPTEQPASSNKEYYNWKGTGTEDALRERNRSRRVKRHQSVRMKLQLDPLDPTVLRKKGSHVHLSPLFSQVPTEAEEAVHLGDQDLASMSSHRFNRTFHRKASKMEKSVGDSIGGGGRGQGSHSHLRSWDRTPHELFIELDELSKIGGEFVWREVSRWIKYEQNIEEGSQRWGRPHVSSLSFHSLLELRRGIATGSVMLDVVARDWFELATLIAENLMITVEIRIYVPKG